MKTRSFSRDERKTMIVTWFALRVQKGNFNFATLAEIAKGLDVTPSSHLAKIVSEMVEEKRLTFRRHNRPGRWVGHEFMLQPGTYEIPRARQISLKINGRDSGQLELL